MNSSFILLETHLEPQSWRKTTDPNPVSLSVHHPSLEKDGPEAEGAPGRPEPGTAAGGTTEMRGHSELQERAGRYEETPKNNCELLILHSQ